MRYSRKSRSWSLLCWCWVGSSALLIALTWVWVGDPFFPGSSIAAGILVFLFTGLCLGPFLIFSS